MLHARLGRAGFEGSSRRLPRGGGVVVVPAGPSPHLSRRRRPGAGSLSPGQAGEGDPATAPTCPSCCPSSRRYRRVSRSSREPAGRRRRRRLLLRRAAAAANPAAPQKRGERRRRRQSPPGAARRRRRGPAACLRRRRRRGRSRRPARRRPAPRRGGTTWRGRRSACPFSPGAERAAPPRPGRSAAWGKIPPRRLPERSGRRTGRLAPR